MAPRNCFFFWSFFIFLCFFCLAAAKKEANDEEPEDSECNDPASYKCGEPAGPHCNDHSCYTFNVTIMTWNDSQNECRKYGADLVSIETKDELKFIHNEVKKLKSRQTEWYIGLTVDEPIWQWVSKKPLTIDHWQRFSNQKIGHWQKVKTKEPTGSGRFVVIAKEFPVGQRGSFKDVKYFSTYSFICEIQANGSTVSNGYYCRNTCYRFYDEKKTWEESRKTCNGDQNGDLVSLETEEEWKFVNDIIQERPLPKSGFLAEWFIGLSREPRTSWKWVNGKSYSLTDDMWQTFHPIGKTPYGVVKFPLTNDLRYVFKDAELPSEKRPFICEKTLVYKPPTK